MPVQTALIVDADPVAGRLARRLLESRGYAVETAGAPREALALAGQSPVSLVLTESRFRKARIACFLRDLRTALPDARILVHTDHGSIAGAVLALRAGAVDYLEKTPGFVTLQAALDGAAPRPDRPDRPMSAARRKWEHLNRIWLASGGDFTAAAQRLGMNDRNLRRMLGKRSPA